MLTNQHKSLTKAPSLPNTPASPPKTKVVRFPTNSVHYSILIIVMEGIK